MSDETDWNSNIAGGFGTHAREDEFFHGTGDAGDTLTETWFWNFHVPEAAINCYAYCWVHPNLKVVTAGLMLYKGIKGQHLASELFDIRDYMSQDIVGDGSHMRFPNGMEIRVVEPMQEIRFSFADPSRNTSFDIALRAVGIPVMRANNKHFEQVMHASGELVLRGERHLVDAYPVRDRSWGEQRPENHAPTPPYTWVTGTFGEDFAFNLGAHDDPARGPEWLGKFDTPARIFKDGWVVVKGEQRRIVSASKITKRQYPQCRPVTHAYTFTDSSGEVYNINGTIIAQSNWSGWSNMNCHLGLVEWNWNGHIGYGDSQEVQWNDYVWKMGQSENGFA